MKLVKNTLEASVETWDDPGDYPNALAAGPLPSYDYLAGVEGELVYELTEEEAADYTEDPDEFVENLDGLRNELPEGVEDCTWLHAMTNRVLTLLCDDAVGDKDVGPADDGDYDDDDDDYDYTDD